MDYVVSPPKCNDLTVNVWYRSPTFRSI